MIQAVIFDLDGVIVSTDEYHYQAWKQLADAEGISFDRAINERLRGVSRMESLDIILERSSRHYCTAEKLAMAHRKNATYQASLCQLTPSDVLAGVAPLLDALRSRNVKIAIGSSSKNARPILRGIGMEARFNAIADGTCITRSKPDPEVFLIAARMLLVQPRNCLVVEDAEAGVSAALAGGMRVLGVGSAASDPRAHFRARGLDEVSVDGLLWTDQLHCDVVSLVHAM